MLLVFITFLLTVRSSDPEGFCEIIVLKNFKKTKGTPAPLFNAVASCKFIEKEAYAQVLPYEFCKNLQNSFFMKHLQRCIQSTVNYLRSSLQFYLKKTPWQVLPCKFLKTFKNVYFVGHLQRSASKFKPGINVIKNTR